MLLRRIYITLILSFSPFTFGSEFKVYSSDLTNKQFEHRIIQSVSKCLEKIKAISNESTTSPKLIIIKEYEDVWVVYVAKRGINYQTYGKDNNPIIFSSYTVCINKSSWMASIQDMNSAYHSSEVTKDDWLKIMTTVTRWMDKDTIRMQNLVEIEMDEMSFHPNIIRVEIITPIRIRCYLGKACKDVSQPDQNIEAKKFITIPSTAGSVEDSIYNAISKQAAAATPVSLKQVMFINRDSFEFIGFEPTAEESLTHPPQVD